MLMANFFDSAAAVHAYEFLTFKIAYKCDFHGPVYRAFATTKADDAGLFQCGDACFKDMKCTHFVHRDGLCFLKYYPGRLNTAADQSDSASCGQVLWTFNTEKQFKISDCIFDWKGKNSLETITLHGYRNRPGGCAQMCREYKPNWCTHFELDGNTCSLFNAQLHLGSDIPVSVTAAYKCGINLQWNVDADSAQRLQMRNVLHTYAPRYVQLKIWTSMACMEVCTV